MDIFNSWIVNKYVAHRGLHDSTKAENSLSAFKAAIEGNYPIELDVQQIADGTIVVFHDESLHRVTGKDGYVRNIKSKADLKEYKLEGTKDCIPTFDEVLKLINGQVPVMIEVKNTGKVGVLESKLIEVLKKYKGEFCVIAFNPYVLGYFKNNAPEIIRGQLAGSFKGEKLAFFKKFLLKRIALHKVAEPNFISYEAKALPCKFLKKFKHLPLICWTVRSQEDYMKVAKYCDNIVFEGFEPRI